MERKIAVGSVLVGLVLFVLVVNQIGIHEMASTILAIRSINLIPYAVFSVLIMITLAYRWSCVLKSMNFKVGLFNLFMYKVSGFSIGYITPSAQLGGEPMRAYLLKRHDVPYKNALSSVIIDKTLEFTTNTIFAIIGFIFVILHFTLSKNMILGLLIGLALASWAIFRFYYLTIKGTGYFTFAMRFWRLNKIKFLQKFEKSIEHVEKELHDFYRNKPKKFAWAVAISFFSWILMFLEYKFALLLLGFDASIPTLFLVISVIGLAYIIPVPAALGVLEGGQTALFALLKIAMGKGLLLAFIVRIRDLAWTFLGISYSLKYGVFKKR